MDLLLQIIEYFNKNITIKELNYITDKFIKDYEDVPIHYYYIFQVVHIIKMNDLNVKAYVVTENNKKNSFNKSLLIPRESSYFNLLKNNFNFKSIKFRFAFRLAVVLSTSLFINDYYKAPKLMWLPITVFTITQPFFEDTFSKALGKFKGTIIASVFLFFIFNLSINNVFKLIIAVISIFISLGFVEHEKNVIFTTVCSVLFASLTLQGYTPIIYRIFYVISGIVMASIANKFILPYKIDNAISDHANKLINIDIQLLEEINKYLNTRKNVDIIRELLIHSYLISDKIDFYNTKLKHDEIEQFILNNAVFINNLIYVLIYYENNKLVINGSCFNSIKQEPVNLLKEMKLGNSTEKIRENLRLELINIFNKINSKEEKILSINISNIGIITKYLEENYLKIS